MHTIADLLQQGSERLQGLDNPQSEARLLLAYALNKDPVWLMTWPEKEVSEQVSALYQQLLERRVKREPLAYLLGNKEFWSLPLKVNNTVLVPRPETELLVETVLSLLPNSPLSVLELGTGSGAIACALAHSRPAWNIIASDISSEALTVAKENAHQLALSNIQWYQADWFNGLPKQKYAAVISNPPYLSATDPHLIDELLFEPRRALVSGKSGLEAYETIIANAADYLVQQGSLILEHGFAQGPAIQQLLAKAGFSKIETLTDLAGLARVTFASMIT